MTTPVRFAYADTAASLILGQVNFFMESMCAFFALKQRLRSIQKARRSVLFLAFPLRILYLIDRARYDLLAEPRNIR